MVLSAGHISESMTVFSVLLLYRWLGFRLIRAPRGRAARRGWNRPLPRRYPPRLNNPVRGPTTFPLPGGMPSHGEPSVGM